MQEEEKMLKRFLKERFSECDTWSNIALGKVNDWKNEAMLRPVRKRADAVVDRGSDCLLIEAKLKPKSGAIGQLLVYKELLGRTKKFQHLGDLPIELMFLTTRVDEEIKEVCDDLDIEYVAFDYP